MIAVGYYLLKVVICSGILYGYYHLALKDKVFHQWNRFYLLGSVLISILLPLVQVEVNTPVQPESKVITVLQMVSGADEYVREVNANPMSFMNGDFLSAVAYGLVSLLTLILFLLALRRIHQMIKKHEVIAIDDFYFLNTVEPGTPFSYFRFLLWNREIPLDTENGQRILEHELVHIREKHSLDKLFMQLTLVIFWINPFFWLIRKELSLVHEFIADKKTVGSGDAQAFARLLLDTSFPGYAPMMANSFFTSSIKRRLAMMTKQQHPGLNYLSRLMMMPVLFILLFAFGVKAKTILHPEPTSTALDKKYTVVIDAAHGGSDAGVQQGEANEKTLTLAIAQLVKQLNTNPNVNILLARNQDELQPLASKVDLARKNNADLYISVHINGSPDPSKSGIEAYVSNKTPNSFQSQNNRLATLILKNLEAVYATDLSIKKRDQGIYVLDKNVCPAVIVEMGYLTNPNDLQFVALKSNQEKLARQVLRSIEDYFNPGMLVIGSPATDKRMDTLPIKEGNQASSNTAGDKKITFIHKDGTVEVITNNQYRSKTGKDIMFTSDTIYVNSDVSSASNRTLPKDMTYTIDGKPSYPAAVERLKPEDIYAMYVNHMKVPNGKGTIDILTKTGVAADPSLLKKFKVPDTTTPSGKGGSTISGTIIDATGGTTVMNGSIASTEPVVLSLTGANTKSGQTSTKVFIKKDPNAPSPIYIINGEEKTYEEINQINPDTISEIKVLKGEQAEKAFGSKGKNGVMVITTKR